MKRLALVLAAALLGTGCIMMDDHCDQRDVTVLWTGFTGPDPVANRSCTAAGVSYVDVFLDDARVEGPAAGGRFHCDDYGVTILGVRSGRHTLTTEGIAADGETILYRDDRQIAASDCGDFSVEVTPAAGYVDLYYEFYSGATKLPPAQQVCTGPWLWLSISDYLASIREGTNVLAVLADADFEAQAYGCGGDNAPLSFVLPAGPYTLEWMEERGDAAAYALRSADCTDRDFDVGAAAATDVPVRLDRAATASCP